MPVDSTADRFIKFLQSRFSKQVDIPKTTDVLRIAEFPGLESKREDAMPDMSAFEGGMVPEEPMEMDALPMPGSAMGPLTSEDDDLL